MTRKEITGTRSLDFSKWVREMLPDSQTGYSASDLDFILWNWKTKNLMFLEIKTRNAKVRQGQKMMFENINKWIKTGIDNDWKYHGFHLITFENSSFEDGKCYFDNQEITQEELIKKLSFL